MLTKQGVKDLSRLGSSSAAKRNYAHQLCEHHWYYEDHGQLGKTRECTKCHLYEAMLEKVYRPPWIEGKGEPS